jgi:hypothetical protein
MANAWLRLAEIAEKFGDALCGLATDNKAARNLLKS